MDRPNLRSHGLFPIRARGRFTNRPYVELGQPHDSVRIRPRNPDFEVIYAPGNTNRPPRRLGISGNKP